MLGWGAGLDAGMLYFDVRLAEHYPTVEIRVADVCHRRRGRRCSSRCWPAPWSPRSPPTDGAADLARRPAPGRRLAGRAAPGSPADLVHPVDGALAPAREVFEATVDSVRPALEEAGDLDRVQESFERLVARGTGATRQRRVHEDGGDLRAVVEDLARRTEESWA